MCSCKHFYFINCICCNIFLGVAGCGSFFLPHQFHCKHFLEEKIHREFFLDKIGVLIHFSGRCEYFGVLLVDLWPKM